MRCKDVFGLLSSFQDNELDKDIHTKITGHLQECELCQKELSLFERVVAGVKEIPEIEPQHNLTALVMHQVNQAKKPRFLSLATVLYTFVFVLFSILAFMVDTHYTTKIDAQTHSSTAIVLKDSDLSDFSDILAESQYISLLQSQESTINIFSNGRSK